MAIEEIEIKEWPGSLDRIGRVINYHQEALDKIDRVLSKLNSIEQRLETLEQSVKKSVSDSLLEYYENKE